MDLFLQHGIHVDVHLALEGLGHEQDQVDVLCATLIRYEKDAFSRVLEGRS